MDRDVFVAQTQDVAVYIGGDDRLEWLQGQFTQDIRGLSPSSPINACLLTATGQMRAMLRIHDCGQELAVVTSQPAELITRIEQFVIMEDVVHVRTTEPLWSAQGAHAPTDRGLPNPRTARGGVDLEPDQLGDLDEIVDADYWNIKTLEWGWPIFGIDTDEKTFPQELGEQVEASLMSYQKGCYVGQEVMMRIHSRGHVNRHLVELRLENWVNPGELVTKDGATVGKVMRLADSPQRGLIASALIRSSVGYGEAVEVDGTPAEVGLLGFQGDRK